MRNVEGVQSVAALSGAVRKVASGLKEGSLKWRTVPRDPYVLAQTGTYVPTGAGGLLNAGLQSHAGDGVHRGSQGGDHRNAS